MKPRSIDRLTKELFEEFGDRKRRGRIDFVYDVQKKVFYAVPKEQEHSEFMQSLGGTAEALIPVQLRLYCEQEKMRVTHLLVGASSFEAEAGIRHPPAYLCQAFDSTLVFLGTHPNVELRPEHFRILWGYASRKKRV